MCLRGYGSSEGLQQGPVVGFYWGVFWVVKGLGLNLRFGLGPRAFNGACGSNPSNLNP